MELGAGVSSTLAFAGGFIVEGMELIEAGITSGGIFCEGVDYSCRRSEEVIVDSDLDGILATNRRKMYC